MRTRLQAVLVAALSITLCAAYGQFGGGRGGGMLGGGPKFGAGLAKLFGDNPTFTADVQVETGLPGGDKMVTPGKMAFDQGKTRFEIDLGQAKGGNMPPDTAAQMKSMGMDKMIVISRPDKKQNYMVYPGLNAYAEMPQDGAMTSESADDFKVDFTELGPEEVNGQPAVKHKAVITDPDGKKHEATLWKSKKLKNFPVRIEQKEGNTPVTLTFSNVEFAKPEAKKFEPPTEFTKYESMQAMMQQEMMKKFGGGQAVPGQPPRK